MKTMYIIAWCAAIIAEKKRVAFKAGEESFKQRVKNAIEKLSQYRKITPDDWDSYDEDVEKEAYMKLPPDRRGEIVIDAKELTKELQL